MQSTGHVGRQIAIVDIGSSNITRMRHSLRALGHTPVEQTSASAIAEAPIAIVPGSGDLRRALSHVELTGIADGLRARAEAGLPTLGIGLGAYILFEGYHDLDHSGAGLGLLPGIVRRMPDQGVRGETLASPHLGWNKLTVLQPTEVLPSDDLYYFAHDRVVDAGASWGADVLAHTEHTLIFPAAVAREKTLGLLFHPELSGAAGLGVLARFCAQGLHS